MSEAAQAQSSRSGDRRLLLNLFIHGRGHHEAAWRHPKASPLDLTDVRYYVDLAQTAEAACFDSVFLADPLAAGPAVAAAPPTRPQPPPTPPWPSWPRPPLASA